jgi:hypothetical protein
VANSYRKLLWILAFGLLLVVAEYGLAFQQSGRPHRSLVEQEFGQPDPASGERPASASQGSEPVGNME